MNRNFYAKRIRVTKNGKVLRRASNIAHTTSTDRTVTKQRRKRKTTLSKGFSRKVMRVMSQKK
jgi:ribosomal protein L35